MRHLVASFVIVACSASTGSVPARDGIGSFPSAAAPGAGFRGDAAHTGIYPPTAGPALGGMQWRFVTDGDVVSSPAVVGDTVYIGSGDGRLYALDRTSGAERWRYDAGSPVTASPAVAAGLVYAGTRDGRYFAVDASSGALRWSFSTGPVMPWPWGHESGDVYTSSPTYSDRTLVVGGGDGNVYALDGATGRKLWQAATSGRVRSSPAIAGATVFVGSADGRVYAFDLASGAERWRFDTEGVKLKSGDFGFDRRTVQSSPAVSNGTVFVGARDGWIYAIDAASGKERWRYDHKVSWINTSPAVADDVVYAGSSDGQFVQAVEAATGRELWRTKVGVTWSSPSVAGNIIYDGDGDGFVNSIDRRTGTLLWRFRTGSQVFSTPVPAGDLVIVGSTDGAVYALRTAAGPGVHRAVFHDSTLAKAATVPDPPLLSRYLKNRGYEVIDAQALGAFLAARIADREPSVVVFATDMLPAAVNDSVPERALLRRYLDAGGKVVWPGVPPLLFPRDPATGQTGGLATLDWSATSRLLGVPHGAAMFDQRGARATAIGSRWGLPVRWRGAWGIEPDSSIVALSTDEFGLVPSWVRNYGGQEGTGFVRVPADNPMTVYLAAEYRPSFTSNQSASERARTSSEVRP